MKSTNISISKIFISGAVIGLLTGIAIMYLINGLLGHAHMIEAVLAFCTFQGTAAFAITIIFKRLSLVWNISVVYPVEKPLL